MISYNRIIRYINGGGRELKEVCGKKHKASCFGKIPVRRGSEGMIHQRPAGDLFRKDIQPDFRNRSGKAQT